MTRKPIRAAITLLAFALLTAACSSGSDATTTTAGDAVTTTTAAQPTTTQAPATTAPTTPPGGGEGVELSIAAEDSEGFTRDRLAAPANVEVTVEFQNKDVGGEPHNWHIAVDPGVEEYATIISQGPDTQEVTFTIGTPGDYDYWCDTHAEAMRGVFTATP